MNVSRQNNSLLLKISLGVCILSVAVFSFLLMQSNDTRQNARAADYNGDQVIIAVNQERVKNGLNPLIVNPVLMTAAQNKANHMAQNKYFSHIGYGKKWSDFIKEVGYNYAEAGENLANGFDSVPEMVTAWMNSPSHRENILNSSIKETGVGISFGELEGYPTIFVAQVFGRQVETNQQPLPQTQPSAQNNSQPAQPPTVQNNPPSQNQNTQEQKPPDPPIEHIPPSLEEIISLPEVIVGQ